MASASYGGTSNQRVIADVFTMELDGSDVQRVTDFGCMSWAPFFIRPRLSRVHGEQTGFANFELFIVDARGEHEPGAESPTPTALMVCHRFPPDGKRLTWTSTRARTASRKSFSRLNDGRPTGNLVWAKTK